MNEPIRALQNDWWDMQPSKGRISVNVNENLHLNYIYLSQQRLMAANVPQVFFLSLMSLC